MRSGIHLHRSHVELASVPPPFVSLNHNLSTEAATAIQFLSSPALDTSALAKQKILDDELTFTSGKWSAADSAGDRAVGNFGIGIGFDYLIERVAILAMERYLTGHHNTAPTINDRSISASGVTVR